MQFNLNSFEKKFIHALLNFIYENSTLVQFSLKLKIKLIHKYNPEALDTKRQKMKDLSHDSHVVKRSI